MRKRLSLLLAAAALAAAAPSAWAVTTTCDASGKSTGSGVCVAASEKLPGVTCVEKSPKVAGAPVYYCPVEPGFGGFFAALRGLLKYGIVIGLLFGVLMIVVSGIRIATSEAAEGLGIGDQRTDAKMMLVKVISGIVALALVGFILNTVAPWVFTG